MSNFFNSNVPPETVHENRLSINQFLHQSYDHAKKQIGHGVSFLQDGVSFIKDEFTSFVDKTGECINNMILPVNNFIKDLAQMDHDFQNHEEAESSSNCSIVPIEIALLSPMEENY